MRVMWAGAAISAAVLLTPVTAGAQPTVSTSSTAVSATVKPKTYANCTALNKVYKHGVGRAGARDKVARGATPVKNFRVNTKVYNLNKKSDRDKDGIACEKR